MEKCLEFLPLVINLILAEQPLFLMKDGKVFREQDFFDNHSFLMQLGLL